MSMKSKQRGKRTSAAGDDPVGKSVKITDDYLAVTLDDGRVIQTPLEWYPRLKAATRKERTQWKWWGSGRAIHWPALDEHLGIAGMLRGMRAVQCAEMEHAA
jgi:hypothetical protein